MTPRIVIQIRVSAAEKRAIQRAAKRAGMDVSAWLRALAMIEAEKA